MAAVGACGVLAIAGPSVRTAFQPSLTRYMYSQLWQLTVGFGGRTNTAVLPSQRVGDRSTRTGCGLPPPPVVVNTSRRTLAHPPSSVTRMTTAELRPSVPT